MMRIDPQDPRVIWRRAYRVGKFDAASGPVDITPEMMAGSLKGFEMSRAAGVLPSVVYDHAEGTQRLALGHVVGLEKRDDGWAWAGFAFEIPADHVEYADFTSRTEAAFRAGTIADVSIEARFNVKNVAYYGEWVCPMEINAIAVLPPGDFPAIPGAGREMAAGTAQKAIAFRVSIDETADAATAEERIVEEKLAALASRVEVVEKGIEECKAGIGKLVQSEEAKAKAAADAAEAAAKAKADAESDSTFKAARAKIDNRMVAGTAEKVDASLKALDSPAARLAVLATLDAMLPAKLSAGDGERLDGKAAEDAAKAEPDPAGDYVKVVMARDNSGFAAALVTACNEKPELFAAPQEG